MWPDRVEDWPTRTAHVPTLVRRILASTGRFGTGPTRKPSQSAAAALIGEWIGLTAPIRRIMSQHVDEIAYGRKSETEQLRILSGRSLRKSNRAGNPAGNKDQSPRLPGCRPSQAERIPDYLGHLNAFISWHCLQLNNANAVANEAVG